MPAVEKRPRVRANGPGDGTEGDVEIEATHDKVSDPLLHEPSSDKRVPLCQRTAAVA